MADMLGRLPRSWSELSWQQLCGSWDVKVRYGGNADVARLAALLRLLGLTSCVREESPTADGETSYILVDGDGCRWMVTPREAAYLAARCLPWFDYPYGDPGEKEQKDSSGKVVRERREAVTGYVGPMRDAMAVPRETITVRRRHFALPQVACSNLTWQQYRSLQGIAPRLFQESSSDEEVLLAHAEFLANILTPRSLALLDTNGGSIRLRPHYEYRYDASRADALVPFWKKTIRKEGLVLFQICFQVYQTALSYYSSAYPLLFTGPDRNDQMRDALQGEVGTVNTIMKYAGYAEQQQVYDSNLPFVLDILNTMTKEAKEIERMNSKIKKK